MFYALPKLPGFRIAGIYGAPNMPGVLMVPITNVGRHSPMANLEFAKL